MELCKNPDETPQRERAKFLQSAHRWAKRLPTLAGSAIEIALAALYRSAETRIGAEVRSVCSSAPAPSDSAADSIHARHKAASEERRRLLREAAHASRGEVETVAVRFLGDHEFAKALSAAFFAQLDVGAPLARGPRDSAADRLSDCAITQS